MHSIKNYSTLNGNEVIPVCKAEHFGETGPNH